MTKKKLVFNNTYKFGRLSFIVFKEGEEYTAACLEFDLLAKADTKLQAIEEINDAAEAWLMNVIENKLPEELLNRPAPKRYWNIRKKILKDTQERKGKSRVPATAIFQTYTPQNFASV